MAIVSVPRWSIYVVLAALIASVSFSFGALYTARGDSHDATYYACLYAGSLTQVSTTPPANCGRGQQISWNSEGTQGSPGIASVQMRTSDPVIVEALNIEDGSVECLPGEHVVGGGYNALLVNVTAVIDRPLVADEETVPTGWFVRFYNDGSGSVSASVYVLCAAP